MSHHPPFGPAYGGSPYAPPRPTNGLAVASLVCALTCLPPVGLVLGVIALVQLRRRHESGKGMAVAGVVVSAVSLVIIAVSVVLAVIAGEEPDEDGRAAGTTAPTRIDPATIEPGDCFNLGTLSSEEETEHGSAGLVPCDEPHQAEAYAVLSMDEGPWPGDDAVAEWVGEHCEQRVDDYILDSWTVPFDVFPYHLQPTSLTWANGDRGVICSYAHEERALEGSLRVDASMLDEEQVFFLTRIGHVDAAYGEQPAFEDLDAQRQWAEDLSGTLTYEADVLHGHDWEDAARKPAAGLVEEIRAAAALWEDASGAADAAAYEDAYDAAFAALDLETEVSLRRALDLESDPSIAFPSDDEYTTEPADEAPAADV
ncbi:DUF4190 domain-containing protein [Streptomyces sp. GSL17-111]|uniref:DUF4190 domain-containing protein n=1 Tax=Streptomyces sp. GSL17-111 TaxID=3121596 RepID=UPI0030F44B27